MITAPLTGPLTGALTDRVSALGQGGGALPGYVFLKAKSADGGYSILRALQADSSRVKLQGKVA